MKRQGMTLVELLVVVAILTLVTAATVPMMTMGNEGRRTREAARFVTSQIQAAQTKAIATGKPAGVMFERERTNPNVCVTISQAAIPANYTGYSLDSACVIVDDNKARFYQDPWVEKFVKRGDRIRFGVGGGVTWVITGMAFRDAHSNSVPGTQFVEFTFDHPSVDTAPLPPKSGRAGGDQIIDSPDDGPWGADNAAFTEDDRNPTERFTVYRQPERTSDLPVTLPGGACIDLAHSGTETNATAFASPINTSTPASIRHEPVIIMFNPSGDIQSLQDGYRRPLRAVERTYFLVGKPENVPLPGPGLGGLSRWTLTATDENLVPNWRDLENYWVSISFTNTFTAPAKVAFVDPPTFTTEDELKTRLASSRRLVREGKIETGR